MVRNYFDGQPPRPTHERSDDAAEVENRIAEAKRKFDDEFRQLNFSRALEAAWAAIARIDKFITDNQPWRLAKDQSARVQLEAVLATAYEGLRHVILIVAPFMPVTSREIWNQMGLSDDPLRISPNEAKWGDTLELSKIEHISPAFPKLDKERIMSEISNETAPPAPEQTPESAPAPAGATQAAAPASQIITIDDFVKVELRAATVLEAEKVPKADKLLRLVVDLGEGQPRQILAGIAEHYSPEDVVGRKIIVVSNLAPRKLRGLESNGMLLAASVGENGRPVLATFGEDVPNGTRLK
jgi:methionyl-tRNA synthetase